VERLTYFDEFTVSADEAKTMLRMKWVAKV
jgi:hypothetical protein